MFTIKQAARAVGTTEATLRTWERRYGIVAPQRTEAGYRLYDARAVATLRTMRALIDTGWSASVAARGLRSGEVPLGADSPVLADPSARHAATEDLQREFLSAAATMDATALQASLETAFSRGSFEYVVDTWLFPALVALGAGWADGEIDVAGEHMASHCVMRRLSAAFEAAGSRSRGPKVVVGLPCGSRHEMGAIAFATAARRVGLDVLYLGADVPAESWVAAAQGHRARAAVMSVVTADDRVPARGTARALHEYDPALIVAAGGASVRRLAAGVRELAPTVGEAVGELDDLLHQ